MVNLPNVSQEVHHMIDHDLTLTNEQLNEIMIKFEHEIKKGLRKDQHDSSEVKCFVTFVEDLPVGTG